MRSDVASPSATPRLLRGACSEASRPRIVVPRTQVRDKRRTWQALHWNNKTNGAKSVGLWIHARSALLPSRWDYLRILADNDCRPMGLGACRRPNGCELDRWQCDGVALYMFVSSNSSAAVMPYPCAKHVVRATVFCTRALKAGAPFFQATLALGITPRIVQSGVLYRSLASDRMRGNSSS